MIQRILSIFLTAMILQACSSGSEGHAPSAPLPDVADPVINKDYQIIQKNSQAVKTNNAWTVDADYVNVIQNKTLSNGWKIEAQYE